MGKKNKTWKPKPGDRFLNANGGGWGGTIHAVEGNTAIVSYIGETIGKFERVNLDTIMEDKH